MSRVINVDVRLDHLYISICFSLTFSERERESRFKQLKIKLTDYTELMTGLKCNLTAFTELTKAIRDLTQGNIIFSGVLHHA